jgi:hypothetical protein
MPGCSTGSARPVSARWMLDRDAICRHPLAICLCDGSPDHSRDSHIAAISSAALLARRGSGRVSLPGLAGAAASSGSSRGAATNPLPATRGARSEVRGAESSQPRGKRPGARGPIRPDRPPGRVTSQAPAEIISVPEPGLNERSPRPVRKTLAPRSQLKSRRYEHFSQVRKVTLAAGAVTLVTGAAIAGTAISASAAIPHTFKICAWGDYYAFAFSEPQTGEVLVAPGHCASFSLGRSTTSAIVTGRKSSNLSEAFKLGTVHFKASKGWSGAAEGSNSHHWLRDFN